MSILPCTAGQMTCDRSLDRKPAGSLPLDGRGSGAVSSSAARTYISYSARYSHTTINIAPRSWAHSLPHAQGELRKSWENGEFSSLKRNKVVYNRESFSAAWYSPSEVGHPT